MLTLGEKNDRKKTFEKTTREVFAFQFAKYNNIDKKEIKSSDFVEPYVFMWDGTKEGLTKKVHGHALKIVQTVDIAQK